MLNGTLKLALQDCAQYKHGFYTWRPKAMEKLEALGFVRKIPHAMAVNKTAWEVTESGHVAFSEANGA